MKKPYLMAAAICAAVMLFLPWMTVELIRGDAGMAVCFLLFFCVDPLIAIALGSLAGGRKHPLWLMPMIPAAAFLAGAWLVFEPGEPAFVRYALVYLMLGIVSLMVSRCVYNHRNKEEAS